MNEWQIKNNKLVKEFELKDFIQAMVFVNNVATLANQANHHPDIFIHDYKFVRIELSTHDTGDVTEKDHQLAKKIDQL